MKARSKPLRTLVVGGILPVIAFTVVEEYLGIIWGVIAGMVFAVGEISYEWFTERKVSAITLGGATMILLLGGVSLLTQEGIWFKLQPAILEGVMAIVMFVTCAMGKPLLVVMAEKQGMFESMHPQVKPLFMKKFSGLTFRIGVFFLLHALLATWAAFYWSTKAWAILKGVGFTGSMIAYMILEVIILRKRIHSELRQFQS